MVTGVVGGRALHLHVQLREQTWASLHLPAFYKLRGSSAGHAQVWLYTPVAVQDQVLGLLLEGQFPEALDIIYATLETGQPWAGTACAQTAMLLLNGEPTWQLTV